MGGWGDGGWLFGWIIFVVLIALVVLAVVVLVRLLRDPVRPLGGPRPPTPFGPPAPFGPPPARDAALNELRIRYARGEVSRDEYLQKAADLGEQLPRPPEPQAPPTPPTPPSD